MNFQQNQSFKQHKVKKGNVIRNYVIWYKVCGGPIKLQFSDLKLLYMTNDEDKMTKLHSLGQKVKGD